MAQWVCTVCGWIYDEAVQEKPFEQQPDDYTCPVCGAPKSAFEKLEEGESVIDKLSKQVE